MVTAFSGGLSREELLGLGCEEESTNRGRKAYVKDGVYLGVECNKCGTVKAPESFPPRKGRLGGVFTNCKRCCADNVKEWREKNPERSQMSSMRHQLYRIEHSREYYKNNRTRELERSRRWYKENPGQIKEWRKKNPDKHDAIYHRRRARINGLPDDITAEQLMEINTAFHNSCALSGEPTDLHVDHVIPLSTGHGGSVYGNLIPLSSTLNTSKNASHLYEWFDANVERFNLSQQKFGELITYLADVNDMTTNEYRKYLDWCFDNPRTI